jgi:hypothetical protein
VGQGLFTIEASRSHSDTPHSVGLLWTRDQPDAEKSTWQHTTLKRDRHPYPGGIRTHNSSKRVGHWDRHFRPTAYNKSPSSLNVSLFTAHAPPAPQFVLFMTSRILIYLTALINWNLVHQTHGQFQWPRGLRPFACWYCGFESRLGHGCLSLVNVVCCQVEVSASDWSLAQRSLTECGVFDCDREASIIRRPWPTTGCCAMKKMRPVCFLWDTRGTIIRNLHSYEG